MILIIPHIPKTGGHSLRFHFDEHLESNERIYEDPLPWPGTQNFKTWLQKPKSERTFPKVIMGHTIAKQEILMNTQDQRPVFATCLRDPAERWVSHYNFEIGKGPISEDISFWEFFDDVGNSNAIQHYLWHSFLRKEEASEDEMYRLVKKELMDFDYVGVLDQFDSYAGWITDNLSIPQVKIRRNVTGKDFSRIFSLDEETRKRLYELCPYDYELYKWARSKINKA